MKTSLKQYVPGMVFNIKSFPIKSYNFTSSTFILIGTAAEDESENKLSKFQLMNIIVLDDERWFDNLPENCIPIIIEDYRCCIVTNNIYSITLDELCAKDTEYLGIHMDPYMVQKKFINLLIKLYLVNNDFILNDYVGNVIAKYNEYLSSFKKDNIDILTSNVVAKTQTPDICLPDDHELTDYQAKAVAMLNDLPQPLRDTYGAFCVKYEEFFMGKTSQPISEILLSLGLDKPTYTRLRMIYSLAHAHLNDLRKVGVDTKYWTDDELVLYYDKIDSPTDLMDIMHVSVENRTRSLLMYYVRKIESISEELDRR